MLWSGECFFLCKIWKLDKLNFKYDGHFQSAVVRCLPAHRLLLVWKQCFASAQVGQFLLCVRKDLRLQSKYNRETHAWSCEDDED